MYSINPYKINNNEVDTQLIQGNKPAMKASSSFPELAEENVGGAGVINEYYHNEVINQQLYISNQILKSALETPDRPNMAPYEWKSCYKITFNRAPILSLYTDQYQYTGGAHGITVRKSENWLASKGDKIPLKTYFEGYEDYENFIKKEIVRQISESEKEWPGKYFENYSELVNQNFKLENYYLQSAPMAVVIFFQQYEIAPYVFGIPTFLIPLAEV